MNNILKGNDIEAKKKGKYEQKRDVKTIEDLMNTRIRKINENIKAVKRDTETEIRKLVAREDRVIGGNRNKKIRLFRVEARSETYKKQIKQCIVKIDNLTKKYVETESPDSRLHIYCTNITENCS